MNLAKPWALWAGEGGKVHRRQCRLEEEFFIYIRLKEEFKNPGQGLLLWALKMSKNFSSSNVLGASFPQVLTFYLHPELFPAIGRLTEGIYITNK